MPANIDIIINGKDMTGAAVNSAKGGLASLGSSMDAVGGKMSAMTVAVGTVVGNLATAGIAKLGEFASSIVTTGVNFDNMKQQANIAFTTMLGSGEKAKSFLDGLQAFAAKTPFEFPDLLMASQRMLAMGFQSDKVLPTLTAIGDAVAGLGGSSAMVDRVTTALGQMQAKGKATGEEMMQLTEAGIPAWEFLAKKIGVSIPEAMKMVTAGAVSADVAIGALTEGMNAKFGGMMEKQSATFGGLASTIKDTFAQVSGQVMQPFFELMTRGLQMIVTWTSSPAFTDGVAGLTRWFQTVSNAATAFFDNLMAGESVVSAMTHAFATLLPPWVISAWTQIKAAVNEVFDVFAGRISAMDLFQRAWESTWAAVNRAIDAALSYINTNLPLWQATLLGWATAAWQWIQDAVPVVRAKLVDWGTATLGWVTTNLPKWKESLLAWAKAAWQWIVDSLPLALDKLKAWGGALLGWLAKAWPTLAKTLLQWGTALYAWIGDVIPKAIDSLSAFVRGLRDKGEGEGTSQLTQMTGEWAGKLWRWIREDVIPQVGPAFMDFIRATLTYGKKMLTSLGTLAKELGLTLWDWIVTITPIAVKKLSEWGIALWGWIKTNAPAWKDKLLEWAGIAWQWIRDVAIPQVKIKLGEWWILMLDWIKTNAPHWKDKLLEWGAAAWEWIRDVAIPQAKIKLEEWGTRLLDWLKTNWPIWRDNMVIAGKEFIDGLRDGAEIAWIRLTDWFFSDTAFGGFVGDILSMLGVQLGPAYGVLYENGKKITYSLNEGSRYNLNSLTQTGSDMGSAISDGLEKNMDMHSPSRVMWGYGEDIVAGLGGGIRGSIGGLRSEMQYVADTIKAAMDRANSDMLASVEYFTNQAIIKAQTAHTKIANAAVDASAILKQMGIDPSKAVGLGPNGELIMPGINKLPTQTNPTSTTPPPSTNSATNNIGTAIGGNLTTVGTSQGLLGGINLSTGDIGGLKESAANAAAKVKDFIAGLADYIGETVDSRNVSRALWGLDDNLTGQPEIMAAEERIRQEMADLLGVNTLYGRLSDSLGAVMDKISSGTDINKVADLLQSAVNFRGLANYYSTSDYANVLPTDTRLTGGKQTTNTFNITLAGSSNATADVMGMVQLLSSLTGTASP